MYRHLHKMKPRTQFFIVVGLLIYILSIVWFAFSTRNQEPEFQVENATVNRDCAPWDGAAFTISIPVNAGTIIHISIWKSPEINFPVTFSFPDDTGQVGNILLLHEVGLPEQLKGTVFFWKTNQDSPMEGKFDLVTEAGQRFTGQFKAEWGDQMALCG